MVPALVQLIPPRGGKEHTSFVVRTSFLKSLSLSYSQYLETQSVDLCCSQELALRQFKPVRTGYDLRDSRVRTAFLKRSHPGVLAQPAKRTPRTPRWRQLYHWRRRDSKSGSCQAGYQCEISPLKALLEHFKAVTTGITASASM